MFSSLINIVTKFLPAGPPPPIVWVGVALIWVGALGYVFDFDLALGQTASKSKYVNLGDFEETEGQVLGVLDLAMDQIKNLRR